MNSAFIYTSDTCATLYDKRMVKQKQKLGPGAVFFATQSDDGMVYEIMINNQIFTCFIAPCSYSELGKK